MNNVDFWYISTTLIKALKHHHKFFRTTILFQAKKSINSPVISWWKYPHTWDFVAGDILNFFASNDILSFNLTMGMSLLVYLWQILHGEQQQAFKITVFLTQKNHTPASFIGKKWGTSVAFNDTPITVWAQKTGMDKNNFSIKIFTWYY